MILVIYIFDYEMDVKFEMLYKSFNTNLVINISLHLNE